MRISDWSSDVCSSDLKHTQRARCAGFGLDCYPTENSLRWRTFTLRLRIPTSPEAAYVPLRARPRLRQEGRSEEHTSELQSLMRISYAVFCLKKKKTKTIKK